MAKKRKDVSVPVVDGSRGKNEHMERKPGQKTAATGLPSGLDPKAVQTVALISIALAVVTFTVYLQTKGFQFLNLDDNDYVTGNVNVARGISGETISWAFTAMEAANWHPVTWLSHMMDVSLYGMNPAGHHITNVLYHTVTSVLLLLLLLRITGALWPSAFVAAIFALHPLHVESVAWVAERKDVLSAFFWVVTIFLYAEYTSRRKPAFYILSLFSFLLGLMSKPMLVTLPIILLLIDLWPLGRGGDAGELTLRTVLDRAPKLLYEKIPFLVLSLLSAAITIVAQGKKGAINNLAVMPFEHRLGNAFIAYVKYIGKTIWPRDLAVLYPIPLTIPHWQTVCSVVILVGLTAAVILGSKRYPYLTVGWFWFVVTLIPVIGLVQVGSQSMADRYTYIPMIGLLIIVGWGMRDLAGKLHLPGSVLAVTGGMAVLLSTVLTWHQLGYWRDNVSLYRHTLDVTEGNTIILNNLANILSTTGNVDEAIARYREAIKAAPGFSPAHYNLGLALAGKGDMDGAAKEYQEAVRLNKDYADAHYNLGLALAAKGKPEDAIREFQEVLRINPLYKGAHNNLGGAYVSRGDIDAAMREFREECRVNPANAMAYTNLGLLLLRKRDLDGAIREFREAISIDPNMSDSHNNLGVALAEKGDFDGAIREYREAVRSAPDNRLAQDNLKGALARKR